MADMLSESDRKKGRRYAAMIEELACKAPDVRLERMTQKLVYKIRAIYGYSRENKKLVIVRYLKNHDGIPPTRRELAAALDWPGPYVFELTAELVAEGKVQLQPWQQHRPVDRCGRGRPALRVILNPSQIK